MAKKTQKIIKKTPAHRIARANAKAVMNNVDARASMKVAEEINGVIMKKLKSVLDLAMKFRDAEGIMTLQAPHIEMAIKEVCTPLGISIDSIGNFSKEKATIQIAPVLQSVKILTADPKLRIEGTARGGGQSATDLLVGFVEVYASKLSKDAAKIAMHAGRVTVQPKDIKLAAGQVID